MSNLAMEDPDDPIIPVTLRELEAGDLGLLKDSMWRSHHLATRTKGGRRAFRAYYVAILEELLARHESRCLVAVNPADSNQILGWILYANVGNTIGVIHYTYVKEPFRNMGLGTNMKRRAIGDTQEYVYTFKNRWTDKLAPKTSEYMPVEEFLDDIPRETKQSASSQ